MLNEKITMKELIDDGVDYLDAGTPLKLTLSIIKKQAAINQAAKLDATYSLYIVSKLKSYYKSINK